MKKATYVLSIILSISTNLLAQDWEWAVSAGGAEADIAKSLSVDFNGDILVGGDFKSSSLNFGQNTVSNVSSGSADAYLVKYDADGNVLWAKQAGGSANDYVHCVRTDLNGNVYMSGYYGSSSMTFEDTTIQNAGSPLGDYYLVKYNASGDLLWVRDAEGSNTSDGMTSIAPVGNQGVVCVGQFQSPSIMFDAVQLTNTSSPDQETYVVLYGTDGGVVWAQSFECNGHDRAAAVDADDNGNIYAGGFFDGNSMNIGANTLTNASVGTSDIFLTKLDQNGAVVWAQQFGGTADDILKSVEVDGFGNLYVGGYYNSATIQFGSVTLTNALYPDNNQFLVKFDANGNVLWAIDAASSGPSLDNEIKSVIANKATSVYVTGSFQGSTLVLGSTTLVNTTGGLKQIFVAELDSSGAYLWAKGVDNTGQDIGNAVGVDQTGGVYVAGQFQSSSCVFNNHTVTNANAGFDDLYLAKFATGVGVNEETNLIGVSIYPNPTTSTITLQTETPLSQAWLTDLAGRRLMPLQPNGTQWQADLSQLPSGMYLMDVLTQEGRRGVKKVVRD